MADVRASAAGGLRPPGNHAVRSRGARLAAGLALALALAGAARGEEAGRLDVYAFTPGGRPAAGVEVEAGPARGRTGPDGAVRLSVPAGQHDVRLRWEGRPVGAVRLPIVWGEISEVIVHLAAEGPAAVDVEAPGWPRAPAEVPAEEIPVGAVTGRAVDARSGEPVAGARVLVRGWLDEGRTDAAGAFRVRVPAGAQTISVIHPDYATVTREVHVPAGGATALEVELTPTAVELTAHRVTGYRLAGGLAALLEERRERQTVGEVLGAEQIAKSGDGDAAAALRRVTGLTVVDGKFVYVRGMGRRYSSTLLNGSTLPSTEPEKRVVPLDLFPTDVIESLAVQKSYSADLPGEFGGGTVQVRTRGIPDEPFFGASVSTTYREGTTGRDGLTYDGGDADFLGYDDGTRALPPAVKTAASFEPLVLEDPFTGEGYPIEVLEALGAAMPNTWTAERKTVPPDLGLDVSFGDRTEALGGALGYRVGVGYDNGYQRRRGVQRAFGLGANGALVPIVDYRTESLTNTVELSALASAGYAPAEGHEVSVDALWVRSTQDETEVYQGLLANDDATIRVTSLNYVEQQLMSTQVRGEHDTERLEVDWRYTFAYASRYQPDWRRTRFDLDPALGASILSNRPEGNQRLFNDLEDFNHDLSGGVGIPFPWVGGREAKVGVGGGYVVRDRESATRRFKFIHRGPRSRDPDVLAQPAERIFAPENLGADGFTFEEITRATDNYEAQQTIEAFFATLDIPVLEAVDLSLGVRVERSRQEVTTFNLFSRAQDPQVADLDTTDVLPAVNLSWRLTDDLVLRTGYGRTLSRPDFRELSSAPFDQVIGAGVFIGNPDLDRTRIDNVDVRLEYYPATDELISIGAFYKRLDAPIETVILGGANRTITLENAEQGWNVGLELEARKGLGFIAPFLEGFYAAGNLALIYSEVELGSTGIATEDERPLQGQSEYVINATLGYEDPETGLSLAILYNVFGERIVGIGTFGLPDIYEQPRHQVDVVGAWKIDDRWTLDAKLQNLLDDDVRLTQDGRTVSSYAPGRAFSFSLGAKF